jgi:lipoate-protein ligase A
MDSDVVIQHGTIIVDCDFDLMFEVLRTNEKKVRTKEEMTSLSRELGRIPSMDEVKGAMLNGFERALNVSIEPGGLTSFEREIIQELVDTKYGTDRYTLLR